MEETTRVFEVQKTIKKTEIKKDRFILQKDEETNKWFLHTPDASSFNEEELEIILNKLKELNNDK